MRPPAFWWSIRAPRLTLRRGRVEMRELLRALCRSRLCWGTFGTFTFDCAAMGHPLNVKAAPWCPSLTYSGVHPRSEMSRRVAAVRWPARHQQIWDRRIAAANRALAQHLRDCKPCGDRYLVHLMQKK